MTIWLHQSRRYCHRRTNHTSGLPRFQTGFDSSTYQHICAGINSCGISCIAVLSSTHPASSTSLDPAVLQGALNIVNFLYKFVSNDHRHGRHQYLPAGHSGDPSSRQFNELSVMFGLSQHLGQPTHDLGGTLDVVVARSDLSTPSVNVIDVGPSDHSSIRYLH